MTSKIRIKMGAIEIEYEGSESFLKEELPALLTAVSDLYKSSAPLIGASSLVTETAISSITPKKIEGTTANLAAKLGGGTGPDLIMTAAAQLTFVQNKDKFSRKDLVTEIKSASAYYKVSYFSNLTPLLNGLVKDGKLMEPANGTYSLSAESLNNIGAKLA